MTLIAHSDLPSFARLKQEGSEVLDPMRAKSQDIRELHVGIMNMMPDAALEATERQFLRLLGSSNRIVQFYVHVFSPKSIQRGEKAQAHIDNYYEDFADLQRDGLDALIITGANPSFEDLSQECFWDEFSAVIDWAKHSVCSVMCSCFATHAAFKFLYGMERIKLPQKRWGVYSHALTQAHPLFHNSNTRFEAPHSHRYEISREQAEEAGVMVLAESQEAGLHIAATRDFRFVFSQGHPEYDAISLLKEYKREVALYLAGKREDYPPFPEYYFSDEAAEVLERFKESGQGMEFFPEAELIALVANTWVDTGKSIVNNWLGLIYQITHATRKIPLMEGLDPDNPLGI
jgi:homoserine O-succinyltransferase/O-acetyltransferase